MKHKSLDNNFPLSLPKPLSVPLTPPPKKRGKVGKIKTIYQKRIFPVPHFFEQTENLEAKKYPEVNGRKQDCVLANLIHSLRVLRAHESAKQQICIISS